MFVGETGGCGLPDTKEFFILPSQRKLRKESKHGAFHPHISHGAPSGREPKRCHSQGRKLPKGLGLSHPDPGLANKIDVLKVRKPPFKTQLGHSIAMCLHTNHYRATT